jgi:anthranilate/para-aminobenzoate synthase component II
MFQPLMLERLDDLPLKSAPGTSMTLADLFNWTDASIYGDLRNSKLQSIDRVHRSIQQSYARLLAGLWLAPGPGTPYDAQSMARAKLASVRSDLRTALGRQGLDELTRAHLESLQEVVSRALDARQVIPTKEYR